MLTVDNLSFHRDNKIIFSHLGFSISIASSLIIAGKNGCGKSSLLKILAGISKASAGKILWGGENIEDFQDEFNGDLQFIGHKNFLKLELTVKENLRFFARLTGTEILLPSAIKFFSLEKIADEKAKKLSAGWQKRVILAKLICCPATIWLLDEPSNNLDKEGTEILCGLIKTRVKEDGLVIIATHDERLFNLGPKLNLEDYSHKGFRAKNS